MKRIDGMICIDELPIENGVYDSFRKIFRFEYNNTVYYYKAVMSVQNLYNELIAEEIAKEFGIPCVSYDLASFDAHDTVGVISEDFIKDKKFVYMEQILSSVYGKEILLEVNNLEDIWNAFFVYYGDLELVNKLYDQVLNLFLFDILIGNSDRHDKNYGLIEDGKEINLSRVFDNGEMLNSNAVYSGWYRICVDRSDYFNPSANILKKFISVSDEKVKELLNEKLSIISEENILRIIDRVEKKIGYKIEEPIKNKILLRFNSNRRMISKCLNQSSKHCLLFNKKN